MCVFWVIVSMWSVSVRVVCGIRVQTFSLLFDGSNVYFIVCTHPILKIKQAISMALFFRFVFSFCLSRAAVAVYSVAMTLNVDMHGKYTRKSTNRITKMFIVFFFYLRFFERSNSLVRFFCALLLLLDKLGKFHMLSPWIAVEQRKKLLFT